MDRSRGPYPRVRLAIETAGANPLEPGGRRVSQKDIDKAIQDTRTGRKCRCQEIGLRPGLTVAELNRMGAGCTGSHMPSVPGQRHALPLPWVGNLSPGERVGYVCPVLNRVRRALES